MGLRDGFGGGRLGYADFERCALGGLERGLRDYRPTQPDTPFTKQRLDPLAREAAGVGQGLVESLATCGDLVRK